MIPTTLLLLLSASPASAQDLTDAQQIAHEALRLEFLRDEVTAPVDELTAKFGSACERGYQLACERQSWLVDGKPDLQAASATMEKACDNGDPLACLVVGWAFDEAAPGSEDPERTWRAAARVLKMHCDGGFQPACHEYAFFLHENKGLTADPRAALLRWQPACDGGFQPSCRTLALLQIDGAPGVSKNPREGFAALDTACKAGDAAACFVWGKEHEQEWTSAETHEWYQRLCDEGHRDSCWKLGLHYLNGTLEAPVPGITDTLMRRGCELGHANACYEAGRNATASDRPDWVTAAELYRDACRHGDPDGCTELVELIVEERVEGTVRADAEAFDVSCERKGHARACTELALGLMAGIDLPREPYRARELLTRSCTDAESSGLACAALGQAFEEGLGGDRDRTEAAKFYRWACYQDRFDACERRGDLLATGTGIRRDDHEALAMYERACKGDVSRSCRKAAVILDQATYVTRNPERAAELYLQACDSGVASGCAGVGRLREEGLGGAPDFAAAREAYERGVAMDDVESRRLLARLLWNGLGGKKDKRRAKALSSEACQKGDPVACRGPEFL